MIANPEVVAFEQALEAVLDGHADLIATAVAQARFPRALIEALGAAGVFRQKWPDDEPTDLEKHILLGRRLGRVGSAGIAVGVSLHDSAISILRRFGRAEWLREITRQAIDGEAVLCIAASEESGGSDLQQIASTAEREGDGYRLYGQKKFVSLSSVADVALILVRERTGSTVGSGCAVFAVPTDQVDVGPLYAKVGSHPLETAPISFDTWVPERAMVARAGTGLFAISWGLGHERLSIAAQILGGCDLALSITLARMKRRSQFGKPLFDHQALRLRVADLRCRVDMLDLALRGLAAPGDQLSLRAAAGLKVTAARLGEEVLGECMHIFGGIGYLTDHSPLGRMWEDMKLARVGGGTDEVLWELVAASMEPDFDSYERLVADR